MLNDENIKVLNLQFFAEDGEPTDPEQTDPEQKDPEQTDPENDDLDDLFGDDKEVKKSDKGSGSSNPEDVKFKTPEFVSNTVSELRSITQNGDNMTDEEILSLAVNFIKKSSESAPENTKIEDKQPTDDPRYSELKKEIEMLKQNTISEKSNLQFNKFANKFELDSAQLSLFKKEVTKSGLDINNKSAGKLLVILAKECKTLVGDKSPAGGKPTKNQNENHKIMSQVSQEMDKLMDSYKKK